jgi:cell division septum initiation protein DivIVA
VIAAVQHWLAARTDRERRLVAAAAAVALVAAVVSGLAAVHDDLARLRARVEGHERELAQVRRLAATLRAAPAATDDTALLTRVQAAADAAGLTERVAAMTPSTDDRDQRLAVRVAGASLADTVHLLHELDADAPGPRVARLGLRTHPDDPRRFDLTLEVTGGHAP